MSSAERLTPTLKECVREDLDCVCGVHGYKLFAECDYVCDSCGNSEYAEFRTSPIKKGRDDGAGGKHIRPSPISSNVDEEYFLPLPTIKEMKDEAPVSPRLRVSLFRRTFRAKSAPL
jgi:hypothetical protein